MPLSLEELRERARPWTEPISPDAPAGASAKHEPAYELVAQEVARLESPTGAPVSWSQVVTNAGEFLRRSSKDLWLASYFAYGLHATEGLRGTVTGITVLAEVLERYWPALFPETARMRGRSNAVGWFVHRLASALPSVQVAGDDRELVVSLDMAARRLADIARARFEDQGPALGPLLEGVERLVHRLPVPPPPTAPSVAPAGSMPFPVTAPALPAPPTSPVGSAPGSEAILDYLRGVGGALAETSRLLRKANAADPLAYRLLRVGLWLHLTQPPPAGPEGRTHLSGLPLSLREQLERLESHARWVELLEEAESAMGQYRFVLDLQRASATALAGLGPSHGLARDAVRLETAAMLNRMPGVVRLLASDGTPLANERTRQWLESEVLEFRRPSPRSRAAPGRARRGRAGPPSRRGARVARHGKDIRGHRVDAAVRGPGSLGSREVQGTPHPRQTLHPVWTAFAGPGPL